MKSKRVALLLAGILLMSSTITGCDGVGKEGVENSLGKIESITGNAIDDKVQEAMKLNEDAGVSSNEDDLEEVVGMVVAFKTMYTAYQPKSSGEITIKASYYMVVDTDSERLVVSVNDSVYTDIVEGDIVELTYDKTNNRCQTVEMVARVSSNK